MRALSFVKLSPTGNMTVLVTSPVPRVEQPAVARALLAAESIGGEQVGFVETPSDEKADARLQMMGGEFCGNASMSLGTLLARRDGLADGQERYYLLEVSGSDTLVPCHIQRHGDTYSGTVRMPLPESIETCKLMTDRGDMIMPVVTFPGITHVIADDSMTLNEVSERIRQWNETIGADALGLMLYDSSAHALTPFVYVVASDTAVAESCCGSGSAALAAYLSSDHPGEHRFKFTQPGGTLEAETERIDGHLVSISIRGTVRITAEGTAYIP